MRWEGDRESSNVEDQRGGGMGKPMAIAGGGIGTVVLVVLALLFGRGNLGSILNQGGGGGPGAGQVSSGPPGQTGNAQEDRLAKFASVVLADTEDVWREQLPKQTGTRYVDPKLVLFRDQVESACGSADSAVGPFYCPADSKVYIDLSFYDELSKKFGAPGDFAEAYVIAHEVGHHVQNLLGISDKVHQQQRGMSKADQNKLSVRLELQADFLAGVWAHHAQRTKNILEPGDVEEALNAAKAIGDDTLQKRAGRRVVPDSFTHGSSQQRLSWFLKGFQTGDVKQGDTFTMPDPVIRPSDVKRPPPVPGRQQPPPIPKPKSDDRW